jgi:putative component of membrane protein insertase Oxa1/YidC/SpoIIIJ protein YidD
MFLKFFSLILFISPFETEETKEAKKSSFIDIPLYWFIKLHQNYLTHIDGPRSHYIPCSSSYMKEAIKKKGPFIGVLKGMDRLLRENSDPWVYRIKQIDENTWIKLDPVDSSR